MYRALSLGNLGLKLIDINEALLMAKAAGFQGLELDARILADEIERYGVEELLHKFDSTGIRPAGWSLPIDFRNDEESWRDGLEQLPRLAEMAAGVDCKRCFTWIMPCSDERAFNDNYEFHRERLAPIAATLADFGCRLGLEFVGPKTLRDTRQFPFIHTMEEMLELADDVGDNAGLLLDSFHWHTSGSTTDDIRDLCTPENVVYVHVNDAAWGLPIDEQIDKVRGLPGVTGVIDIRGFLATLEQVGYDGPVVPEPFGGPVSWAGQSLEAVWRLSGL